MYTKDNIRRNMTKCRNKMQINDVVSKSKVIAHKLFDRDNYRCAQTIFIYVSKGNEVDTHDIIINALRAGKKVAVPRVLGDGKMEYYYINGLDDLSVGSFGVLEPQIGEVAKINEHCLFIMPAVAIDKGRNRVGYGGGYFDRYISSMDCKVVKMCLIYDFQLLNGFIDKESHDEKIDEVIIG